MTPHGTTTAKKRYDPPPINDTLDVTVKIEVLGPDGDEALALADALYAAVEDEHRAFAGREEKRDG